MRETLKFERAAGGGGVTGIRKKERERERERERETDLTDRYL